MGLPIEAMNNAIAIHMAGGFIIGKDEQTPAADLAPRKKGSRGPQGKDGQGKGAQGKKGERVQGEGDQKGQTGPAPVSDQPAGGAKSQP